MWPPNLFVHFQFKQQPSLWSPFSRILKNIITRFSWAFIYSTSRIAGTCIWSEIYSSWILLCVGYIKDLNQKSFKPLFKPRNDKSWIELILYSRNRRIWFIWNVHLKTAPRMPKEKRTRGKKHAKSKNSSKTRLRLNFTLKPIQMQNNRIKSQK